MRRHAKYERSLVLWDPDTGQLKEERMEILRLRCSSCTTTHAVLTQDIIPFFSYSLQAVLALLSLCLAEKNSVPQAAEKTGVSYQLLYRFLLIFHEYEEKLMLFLRREALWESAKKPLRSQILSLLYGKAPPWPQSRFFQILRSPLFLHRKSTVAYPLRIGAALP